MIPGTRNDGLRLQFASVDVVCLRVVGAVPGTAVLAASARNGPGAGTLSVLAGRFISWQAPGSSTPGTPCSVGIADGVYLLEDGADTSKWIRVQVVNDFLASSGQASIFIADTYNVMGPDDVDAADASAGITETVEFSLENVTTNILQSVVLWIDPATSEITVSSDGVNFYAPTTPTDPNALTWSSIALGSSVNFWMRRTIAGTASSNPGILNILQWSWKAPG